MEEFKKQLEQGWDTAVEWYEKNNGQNFWTNLYWYAYKYAIDNDIDGGVCFRMRQDAINYLCKGE